MKKAMIAAFLWVLYSSFFVYMLSVVDAEQLKLSKPECLGGLNSTATCDAFNFLIFLFVLERIIIVLIIYGMHMHLNE